MNRFLVTFLLCILLIPLTGYAGHETGNGGGAMVCRNADGTIRKAELLDLWEAEHIYGMEIPRSDAPSGEQADAALEKYLKLNPAFAKPLIERVRGFCFEGGHCFKRLKAGVRLAPSADAMPAFREEGCNLEGVAYYNPHDRQIYLDQEIYSALSSTDQAALLVHEQLYIKLKSRFEQKNSFAVRSIVGCLFSTDDCKPLDPRPKNITDKTYLCENTNDRRTSFRNRFYLIPDGQLMYGERWEITFQSINRVPVANHSSISLRFSGVLPDADSFYLPGNVMVLDGSYDYILSKEPVYMSTYVERVKDYPIGYSYPLTIKNFPPRMVINDEGFLCTKVQK